MTASAQLPQHPLTFEEYLAFEKQSSWKHELVGGELHAFAGSSAAHNRLALRFVTALNAAADAAGCLIFASDMKLRVDQETGYYPDVMVVCDSNDDDEYYKTAPCIVVEVLSPSTAATDHREKLLAYRRFPSLRDYVIVAQDRREVEYHQRDADGAWCKIAVSGSGSLALRCLDVELTLDQIYAGIVAP
jgi:Uma2 family endonuclease